LRTMTTNTVAIAAMMKADPHRTSAKILRCWSHESNRRHPTSAEVNTIMATNVGKSNTMTTTDAEILGESSENVCRPTHLAVTMLPGA
jgi:transcription initiation factor TFIID subunit TAF12